MTRQQIASVLLCALAVITFGVGIFFIMPFHPVAGVRTFSGVPFRGVLQAEPLTVLLVTPYILSIASIAVGIRSAFLSRGGTPAWLVLVLTLPAAYILFLGLVDLFDNY